VTPPLLLLLVGLCYVLVFGGLTWLRREGFSLRFAVESVLITLIVAGLAAFTPLQMNGVVLILLLYVITMRVRLLIDLGNYLARRGRREQAGSVYQLASRLGPDPSGRLILQINEGVLGLQQGNLDEAIEKLQGVVAQANSGYLGAKQECAAHYNLAVAYERKGLDAQATVEFNAALDTWPGSEYGRRAAAALKRRSKREAPAPTETGGPTNDDGTD
jgi:tetratricopeptide (TPR) repeat protein